jgi:hypothetical protein
MDTAGNCSGAGSSPTCALPTEETSTKVDQTLEDLIREWTVARKGTAVVHKQLRTGIAPEGSRISKAQDSLVEGRYTDAIRIAPQDIWPDGVRWYPQQPGIFYILVNTCILSSICGGHRCTYKALFTEPHFSPHRHRPRIAHARAP